MTIKTPWLKHYGDIPHKLEYPDSSLVALVLRAEQKYPQNIACNFFGCELNFVELVNEIKQCALGLSEIGITRDQRVTICMPNTPQAVTMFYALNLIGAVANMIHPLSATEEIVRYLNSSKSVAIFTLDQFSGKIEEILPRTNTKTLILCGIEDGLSGIKKPLYRLTKGRNIERKPTGGNIIRYLDLLKRGQESDKKIDDCNANTTGEDVAAILYSGGTTGTSKGILLTNRNINALAMQTAAAGDCVVSGNKMMAILPMFHGFGLGVCVHTALIYGCTSILVPQFSLAAYAKLLKKHKPNYIAGIPTLYAAMLRLENIEKLDLSQMMGIFSGGDSLSIELKREVDAFLKKHGCKEQVREGYGLTESVSATCLTPRTFHIEGSIGIPYPDMYFKIVGRGTKEELPYGEEGEIVLSGPTVMKGYDGNIEETAQTLQTHPDGAVWLHTGDLGVMNEDGFIFFRQRIKRIIISSGFNIYPSQLESVIEAHELVQISCVIGIPDKNRGQVPKAFIVLKDEKEPTEEIKQSILEHCQKNITKYAIPREFEYRKDLPRTIVGKVAYAELLKEDKIRV